MNGKIVVITTSVVLTASMAIVIFVSVWKKVKTANKKKRRIFQGEKTYVSIIGDSFVDILVGVKDLPKMGEDTLSTRPIELMAGGSATNTALHLSYLMDFFGTCKNDLDIMLHTVVGEDFYGSFLRKSIAELSNNRIALSSLAGHHHYQAITRTGVCVCLSGKQDRAFVTDRASVATFNVSQLDLTSLLSGSAAVHIAGYYNIPAMHRDLPDILKACKERLIFTSLSPQFDATGKWNGFIEKTFPYLDIVIPNEVEALAISHCDNVAAAARWFHSKGVKNVVITRGDKGAYALLDGKEVYQQSCPSVQDVIDTTGAGDSFNAGLLLALLTKGDILQQSVGESNTDVLWQAALRLGCACGSVAVTHIGASPKPLKEEILKALNEL